MGSQHPSPNVKTLCNFETQIWLEIVTSRDAKSACFNWEQKKKPINRKHINIYLTALVGQSSQGRTPTCPRDKRDKMAILLWNETEKGRFVPGTGPILSRGGVPFVPGTVPVCPGHRPSENVYVYWVFFLARFKGSRTSCREIIFEIFPCQPKPPKFKGRKFAP